MKFEIRKAKNKQFYFRIVAGNGKILCDSEEYKSKQSAKRAIAVIKADAVSAEVRDDT